MPIGEELAKFAQDTFASMEHTHFSNSEAGQDLGKLVKEQYVPTLHKIHAANISNEMKLPQTQQRAPHILQQESKEQARVATMGQHDWVPTALLSGVDKEAKTKGWNSMQIQAEKQRLADGLHMVLRDTKNVVDKRGNIRGQVSQFKQNAINNKEFGVNLDASAIYKPPTQLESRVKAAAAWSQLAQIAIPHIGTLFNYQLNTPTRDLVHGMADLLFDKQNVNKIVQDTGVMRGTLEDMYSVRWNGARGAVAMATNAKVGQWVAQITHSPGFNMMREMTISLGASTGKLHLERMAQDLVSAGGRDTFAAHQLRRFGIDPMQVLKNKGLNDEMLRLGIFRYVDTNAVLDTSLDRSFNSNRNFFTRMGSAYHNYVSRQGKLMRDTLVDSWVQTVGKDKSLKGAAMTAKTMATLGIVFPHVGIGLKALEMYGRGQYQEADPIDDYENLWGKNGPSKALLTAMDGYAHLGAWGAVASYESAILRHQLSAQVIGSIGNEIFGLIQDTGAAAIYTGMGDTDKAAASAKYAARDVLEDTLSDNLGKIIAHQVIPTQKEERSRHPKFSTRMKRDKSFSMKKSF